MFVLTRYIALHELKPLIRYIHRDELIDGARKVIKGLGVELKGAPHSGFRFFKIRVGKKNAGRMIVFLATGNRVIPVLIRLKKDKIFGMNMAMNNSDVVYQISKNMDHILNDLENGDFQEFPL